VERPAFEVLSSRQVELKGGADLGKELERLFQEVDRSYKKKQRPTDQEILELIRSYRNEKRKGPGRNA
jgi:hypothetical protein